MSNSKASQNITILVLKLLFFGLCLAFIVNKIYTEGFNFSFFLDAEYFALFVGLMFLNWGIEVLKWKALIQGLEELSYSDLTKSVLAGLSFGLLTPNRIGNFVGKILYLQPVNRIKGTLFAFYGNYAQLTSTVLFGSLAFAFYHNQFFGIYGDAIAFLPLIFVVGMIILFFHPGMIRMPILDKIFSQEIKESIEDVIKFKRKPEVFGLAVFRHLIFTIQYLLVLSYSPSFDLYETLIAVQLIFFFTTVIPSLIFGKILIRETIAILVLSQLGFDTTFIINAVLFIWMINIALPSLFGSFLFLIKKRA